MGAREVTKKIEKKKKKTSNKGFSFRFNNTINLSIMFVIIVCVSIVELVMYLYSQDSLKTLQNDLSADFISNVQVFNKDLYNRNLSSIQSDLNEVMQGSYDIHYIIIFNDKLKEVYSSLPKDCRYIFRTPNNPATFKLKWAAGIDTNEIRTIYIKKDVYHIYIGMSKSMYLENYMNDMQIFIKIFFSIILLSSIFASFMLARSISKPLGTMEETVSKIAQGDLSGRLDYTKYYEINQLVQSYNMMANALQRLYSTLEAQVQDRTKKLKSTLAELQSTQAMMVHSEKMKSLGELVAGIMHEINNPINFIYGNMTHLNNYSKDLIEIIDEYTKVEEAISSDKLQPIKELKNTVDYEFLKSDLPDLIKSCKEGAERAKNIIQDLKSFSRMEEVAITDVDIPHEIDMTLNILHNKLKNKVEIHKEFMENVPKIEAFGGQLNQVFMNIIDNAAGAIEKTGDVWIRINKDDSGKNLVIEIEDNGVGMDEETSRKVFDPFFTTKPVGQGTGLGMSITHKIIKNHQGNISLESKKGEGTKFTIVLPINIDRELMKEEALSKGEA